MFVPIIFSGIFDIFTELYCLFSAFGIWNLYKCGFVPKNCCFTHLNILLARSNLCLWVKFLSTGDANFIERGQSVSAVKFDRLMFIRQAKDALFAMAIQSHQVTGVKVLHHREHLAPKVREIFDMECLVICLVIKISKVKTAFLILLIIDKRGA